MDELTPADIEYLLALLYIQRRDGQIEDMKKWNDLVNKLEKAYEDS